MEKNTYFKKLILIAVVLIVSVGCGNNDNNNNNPAETYASFYVLIEYPQFQDVFTEGFPKEFKAQAFLGEDELNNNVTLIWVSDIDGDIAEGKVISTEYLSVGEHLITLNAYLKNGKNASETIEIKKVSGTIRRGVAHEGYGTYKWYDHKGIVHYTQNAPPADAKNEDGSIWWETEIGQDEEKELRKKRVQQARLTIKKVNSSKKKNSAPEKKDNTPDEEDVSQKPDEEEAEKDDNEGLFKGVAKLFAKKTDGKGCKVPWLLEKHGICPLDGETPNMDEIGNKFKAVVVNNRKCVWSSCRGTYNGDILIFTYKGQGYWETDGNVPECPYNEGFNWK